MKRGRDEEGEVDMANCWLVKARQTHRETELKGGAFKCKTCNRRFPSFQALGGHRASHKKPKLMGADLSCLPRLPSSTMKPKMHPCPFCGLEFAIGQALGGHMRKHRAAINDGSLIQDRAVPILKKSSVTQRFNLCLDLDLNLTPSENDLRLNLMTPALNCLI